MYRNSKSISSRAYNNDRKRIVSYRNKAFRKKKSSNSVKMAKNNKVVLEKVSELFSQNNII